MNGEVLWKRETQNPMPHNAQFVSDFERSLNGTCFAIVVRGSRNSTFDGAKISKNDSAILVYDSSKHEQIFNESLKGFDSESTFAISPNGETLAILSGKTIYLHSLSK
jgi:hypothetical protein